MPSSSWWRRYTAVAAVAGATVLTGASAALAGFSLTTTAAPTLAVTLDGSDQTASYTMDLSVDNSGAGSTTAGWNLTITSTRFSTGGGATLPTNASSMTAVATVCAVGPCTDPANTISYPVGVPAGATPPAPAKFFSTPANTGIGTFTVTPTVAVSVPANASAGSYTSTLELTLVTGP